jgi:hypothetical protein
MFPSPDSSGTPRSSVLRRVGATLRAFVLLEDPELEARVARGDAPAGPTAPPAPQGAGARAHREAMRTRRTPAPTQHRARRPGAPRTAEQPCLTPLRRSSQRV